MKTGLVFRTIQDINLNSNNAIKVHQKIYDDDTVSILDAIYVRYKFEEYTTAHLRFIKDMMGKFKHSVHICDVKINDLKFNQNYTDIKEYLNNVAIIGTIEINDVDITPDIRGEIGECLEGYNKQVLSKLDRIVMYDNTSKMSFQDIKVLQQKLYNLYTLKNVGICGSPFTNKDTCCISPLFARELASVYGDEKTAVAVESHINFITTGCSCVRSVEIDYDIEYVELRKLSAIKKEGSKRVKSSTSVKKEVKEKKVKVKVKSEPKEKKTIVKNPPLVDFWE